MAMDAGTVAAVAALVVSIMAMVVASAQALQQYLITGQLIRICDGVVYSKMPGRGRRVWEYSQFRFRVVYSIPKVSLRPSLWIGGSPQLHSCSKSHLPLPDLRHSVDQRENNFRYALYPSPRQQKRSEYSAIPGEASWVSFYRVAQQASESDLFYELIDCDADRCPSDLPVAPMQVSLRDTAVIALMAGMRCTNASFEKQTLFMSGEAGTITSSWHPILGATIHFAPHNYTLSSDENSRNEENLGLRIGRGSISSTWMARMWDVVVVAGHQYDLHDRLSHEEFEVCNWVTLSPSRAIVKASAHGLLRSSSPVRPHRLRSFSSSRNPSPQRRSRSSTRSRSFRRVALSTENDPTIGGSAATMRKEQGNTDMHIPVCDNDGDWTFESEVGSSAYDSGSMTPLQNVPPNSYQSQGAAASGIGSPYRCKRVVAFFCIPLNFARLKSPKYTAATDVENNEMTSISAMPPVQHQRRGTLQANRVVRRRSGSVPAKPKPQQTALPSAGSGPSLQSRLVRTELAGQALQDYIADKRRHVDTDSTVRRRLLLPWRPEVEDNSEQLSQFEETEGWVRSANKLHQDRIRFVIEKWQTMVDQRQKIREERSIEHDGDVDTYYPVSIESSLSPIRRSKEELSPKGRSKSRGDSTIRDNGLTLENDFDSETRGRSRTPKVAHGARQSHGSTKRTWSINSSSIAYGDEPIHTFGNMDILLELSGARPGNEDVLTTQVGGNQIHRPDNEDSISHAPANTESQAEHLRQPKKVRIFARDDVLEIASNTSVSSASVRENSVERTSAIGPSRRRGSLDAQHVQVVDDSDRNGKSDKARLREENIQPTSRRAKSILKSPREHFPENESFYREGVAPLEDPTKFGIPPHARWTKISRELVNPEALERNHERFEETDDHVIILRVVTREEIKKLARLTREIRVERERERERQWTSDEIVSTPSDMSDSEDMDKGSQAQNEYNHPVQQGRELSPLSRGSPQGSEINLTSPAASIPSNPMLDKDGFASQTGPRRRRLSTRSDVTIELSPVRRSRSRSTGRRSQLYDQLLLTSHSNADLYTVTKQEATHSKGLVNWFWLSQADALPGYCATPWQCNFSESTCFGAIMTMVVALEYHYTDSSTLRYVEKQAHCEEWIYQGRSTHPSYAINAKGGVVVERKYPRAKFEFLSTRIPPIELLDSDRIERYQVKRSGSEGTTRSVVGRLGEVMCLDSWLSICGRLPEIYSGRNDMLLNTPALVQKIMTDFDFEFSQLKRTPAGGGFQITQTLAERIVNILEKESLLEAEQLFAIVAILRTAKMALCVIHGPDTAKLRDILIHDAQVYHV